MKDKSIFNPYNRITTIKDMLIFGLCLCDLLAKQKIDEATICQTVLIDNIKISPKWNTKNISDLTKNLRLCVLGNCFIVIDEALVAEFGKRPDSYSDNDLDSLRAIIYMLRCTIAHGAMTPRWQATGVYCRKFRINEINYELDATNLDGKIVKHGDYGALAGVFVLIEYARIVIKRHLEGNQL